MAIEDREQEEARFRARRRLLKLGLYLTPTLLSFTSFLDQSGAAENKAEVTVKSKGTTAVDRPIDQTLKKRKTLGRP